MAETAKIRVVVMYGGKADEHSISCISTAGVLRALDTDRFEPVPVGITKYRQGLAKLRPVDAACAAEIIDIADEFGRENLERFGTRRFFCADELFLRAGRPLPEEDYYEGYRQLENGVGMLRSLGDDFLAALDTVDVPEEFFCNNNYYTTAANRISRKAFDNTITCEEVIALCRQNGKKTDTSVQMQERR